MIRESILYLRMVFIASIYIYATILDLKYREVPDDVWVLSYPMGLSLLALDLVLTPIYIMETLLFMAISLILAITPALLGLYGGGDAKALVLLTLTIPRYPYDLYKPILLYTTPIMTLTCFNNGILLALTTSILTLTTNIKALLSGDKPFSEFKDLNILKMIVLYFICYKVSLEDFASKNYLYPVEGIEDRNGELVRRINVNISIEYSTESRTKILERYRELNISHIYVSFGIPLLLFFTIGFIVSPVGDMLLAPVLNVVYG